MREPGWRSTRLHSLRPRLAHGLLIAVIGAAACTSAANVPAPLPPPPTGAPATADAEREEARRRAEELQRAEALRRAREQQERAEAARREEERQRQQAMQQEAGRGAGAPQPGTGSATDAPRGPAPRPEPASDPRDDGGAPPVAGDPDAVMSAIDRALSGMDWGSIGFEPPTHIRLGSVHELRLVLSPRGDEEELAELVPTTPGGAGLSVHRVRFSDRMVARLAVLGSGLAVTAVTPEEQGVSSIEPTTWIWSIEALAGGSHELRLTLDALLDVDGERVTRSIRTFDERIQVAVTPWQRVAPHAAWIALGLLLVGGGTLGVPLAVRRRARAAAAVPARAPAWQTVPAVAGRDAATGAAHDVFISHSSKDRTVAVQICDALEADGIRCWIAPRDITPGTAWDEAIMDALEGCRIMVLVLSEQSNSSTQVTKEVRNAVESHRTVVPFRVEDVTMSRALRYHISSAHWLDAAQGPLQQHLEELVRTVRQLLAR